MNKNNKMTGALSDKELKLMANTIRQDIVKMVAEAKSGHPGGSLGLTDIFTLLYFKIMNHDPQKPDWADRDRFVLSNGHVCPVLYAVLANSGYFPKTELATFRKVNSKLQGHPHRTSVPGLENSSGPLGQGISQAVGMAIVSKREKVPWKVYSIWTAVRNNRKGWFVILLLVNTFSILEMIYIFKVEKKTWAEVKKAFKHGWEILKRTKKEDFKAK